MSIYIATGDLFLIITLFHFTSQETFYLHIFYNTFYTYIFISIWNLNHILDTSKEFKHNILEKLYTFGFSYEELSKDREIINLFFLIIFWFGSFLILHYLKRSYHYEYKYN